MHLVTERGQLLLDAVVDLGGLLGLGQCLPCCLLALVVCGALDLSALLESERANQYELHQRTESQRSRLVL